MEATKYMDALDIAAAEGFEWDYENAADYDLYEAVEILGYWWDDTQKRWHGPEE
jgi:hypothetical protein